jgi:hypothetical protein
MGQMTEVRGRRTDGGHCEARSAEAIQGVTFGPGLLRQQARRVHFSATFFLAMLVAIGVEEVKLADI